MKVGVIDYGASNFNFVHSYALVPEDLIDEGLQSDHYGSGTT